MLLSPAPSSPRAPSPAPRASLVWLAALALPAVLAGCSGSVKANAYWSPDRVEQVRPMRETELLNPPNEQDAEVAATMVGVRHDLALTPSADRKASCSCLVVEVGAASDPKFHWDGAPAEVGADALVLAISPRGVECQGGDADETKRRPSISAVDRSGGDVIVVIEDLPAALPVAQGALIPKPDKGGSVYVRGTSAKLPYARPLVDGAPRCKVY